jgi:hypothetical protein
LVISACDEDAPISFNQITEYVTSVRTSDGTVQGQLISAEDSAPEPSGDAPPTTVSPGEATVALGGTTLSTVRTEDNRQFNSVLVVIDLATGFFRLDFPTPVTSAQILVTLQTELPNQEFQIGYAVIDTAGRVGQFASTAVTIGEGGDIPTLGDYDPCGSGIEGLCESDARCLVLSGVSPEPGGFCAPGCAGAASACPEKEGFPGACLLGDASDPGGDPVNCVLNCDADGNCPSGMSCNEVGGVNICLPPAP